MRKAEEKKNWALRAAAVLLCLTVVSACGVSGLFARYSTSTSGEDSAQVALFGSSAQVTLDSGLAGRLSPGATAKYTLWVANRRPDSTDDAGVSEVAQGYNVEIVTSGNLPLEFELKAEDGSEIGTFIESESKVSETFSTDKMKFEAGVYALHKYTLAVTWPSDKNSAAWAAVPDYIDVKINVAQID